MSSNRTRFLLAALTLASTFGPAAHAQRAPLVGVELRPFVGAFIPTGENRELLQDAVLTGGQLAYRLTPAFGIVGTFAWSPSTDRTTWGAPGALRREADVSVFQYDLGVEGHLPNRVEGSRWGISAFGVAGAGARTYDYRDLDQAAETSFAGFVGVGTDLGPVAGRWALRLEARDYISAFKGLRGELMERKARNDVVLAVGLTVALGR